MLERVLLFCIVLFQEVMFEQSYKRKGKVSHVDIAGKMIPSRGNGMFRVPVAWPE